MNRTADRYRPIGGTVATIVEQHTANIARWVRQTECRLQRPLRMDVTQQLCPLLDIVAQFCNQCDRCFQNVKLKVTVETSKFDGGGGLIDFDNPATIECGRTNITTPDLGGTRFRPEEIVETTNENGNKVFTATLGNIDIGNSGLANFRLRFSKAEPTAIRLILTAVASDPADIETEVVIKEKCGSGPDPLVAVVTTALLCKEDGSTDLSC